MKRNSSIEYKLNMGLRVIYILAFNIYSWYWLYKITFINESTWEDYLNWFFVVAGMHFFVIDTSKFSSKYVRSITDIFNPKID
mgnify:CR=1 FL=1|jgi:hypothetical protein